MNTPTLLLLHRPYFSRLLRLPRWGVLFCIAGPLALMQARAGTPFMFGNLTTPRSNFYNKR